MLNNKFAQKVGVLLGGTAAAQLILLAALPLLTRLYGPEDFGVLAVFSAIVAMCSVVSTGRYELAISLPEGDQEGANIAKLASVCVVGFTLALSLLITLVSPPLAEKFAESPFVDYFWLVPISILVVGLYQVGEKLAIRVKSFREISLTKIAQSAVVVGVQLLFFPLGPGVLIVGLVVGQTVASIRLLRKVAGVVPSKALRFPEAVLLAKRYRDFPAFSTWMGLFNTASVQLVPVFLVFLYGPVLGGAFSLAMRVLAAPATLLGGAVGGVFLSEAPAAMRNGTLDKLAVRLNKKLAQIGAFPLLAVVTYGESVFKNLFGNEWAVAGYFAQCLAPWLYLKFQWSPFSVLVHILRLQRQGMIFQMATLVGSLASLFSVFLFGGNAITAVAVFGAVMASLYIIRMIWLMNAARVRVGVVFCDQAVALFIAALPIVLFEAVMLL